MISSELMFPYRETAAQSYHAEIQRLDRNEEWIRRHVDFVADQLQAVFERMPAPDNDVFLEAWLSDDEEKMEEIYTWEEIRRSVQFAYLHLRELQDQ
jgi:hypothetical protein